MTNLFKKIASGASSLFKKGTSAATSFFKKGGTLEKGVTTVARGVNSAADFVGKGVKLGTKIVNEIDKVPFLGAALALATSLARTVWVMLMWESMQHILARTPLRMLSV